MRTSAAVVAVVLLAGCGVLGAAQKKTTPVAAKAKAACAAKTVSFSYDVVPILQAHCAACHFDNQKWPGLNMTSDASYSVLVNKTSGESGTAMLVRPGDASHSFLVQKLSAKPPAGDPMPTYGRPLSTGEKELLVQWIQQGAKNN